MALSAPQTQTPQLKLENVIKRADELMTIECGHGLTSRQITALATALVEEINRVLIAVHTVATERSSNLPS